MEEEKEFEFEEETETEEVEEVESHEPTEETKTEEVEKPKKQNSKTNAYYKQQRLERENQAYLKGKIDALKVNTYTDEPIENERDLAIFEEMKKAEQEGKEPIANGYKNYFKKLDDLKAEEVSKEKEKARVEEQINKQIDSLLEIMTKDEVNNLLNDNNFKEMFEDVLKNNGDAKKCAKAYMRMKSQFEEQAEIKTKAKNLAKTPSANESAGDYKEPTISEMNDTDIESLFKKKFRKY